MRVLSAASECFPIIKTGGLADVVGALPAALATHGVEVETMLPRYRGLAGLEGPEGLDGTGDPEGTGAGDALHFADVPWAFDRPGGPYLDEVGQDWPDNFDRFLAFSRAVAQRALSRKVDVVHVHDWQAAGVVAFLDQIAAVQGLAKPPVVLTIHNLLFQGQEAFLERGSPRRQRLNLFDHYFGSDWFEFYGHHNLLKGAILRSEAVTTVSERYAQEILTPAFGCGLEDILQYRADQGALHGIVNGLDLTQWNPANDPALVTGGYDAATATTATTATNATTATTNASRATTTSAGKAGEKAAFQRAHGLAIAADRPLLGLVSRLSEQKGIDLLLASAGAWIDGGGQIAAVGSGDPALEQGLQALAAKHPGSVTVTIGYSEKLSHQLHGASDFFAVPSRFEPCGLTQMSAQRYGSLPIVTPVGGLADTVIDGKSGIVLTDVSAQALGQALVAALALYQDKSGYHHMQQAAMNADFSWNASAAKYAQLYRDVLDRA